MNRNHNAMASQGPTPTSKCAKCKEQANKVCSGCKNTPKATNQAEAASYCSSGCQRADWANHKQVCKRLQTRQHFYRVGSLLQQIFYIYREKTFDKVVTKIEKREDGNIYVFYAGGGGANLPTLQPFPASVCEDIKDKQAILCHLACGDALAWMCEIVDYMLGGKTGVATKITEVNVATKNAKRRLIAVDDLGNEDHQRYQHELFKVTLKNGGETFALNLSGAPSGYYEPVIPWDEYVETRVESMYPGECFHTLGGFRASLEERLERGELSIECSAFTALNLRTSKALRTVTIKWEQVNNTTVGAMLKSQPEVFEAKSQELVDYIAVSLQGYLDYVSQQVAELLLKSLRG